MILAVPIIGILVFTLYPMLWAMHKSWFFYTGAPSETRFVGWENFARIFTGDATYAKTWLNTLKFALLKIPVELSLALLLASLLQRNLRGVSIFRAVYFMPSVISIAIIGIIFSNMFDYFGFINAWLLKIGIIETEIDWFEKGTTAMAALVAGDIWRTFGTNVLYFIAAYANVPEEVNESAMLDGANRFQRFFYITIPLIAPVLQTILLLSINGTLQVNEYILVTTKGAPGGQTYTVMAYLADKFLPGFAAQQTNIGYGCAMSLVTSVIMCLIALGYSKLSSKLQNLY